MKKDRMKLIYEVVSTTGNFRLENQDNFYLNGKIKRLSDADCMLTGASEKECSVFAVCDGMGGEDFGEVAADIAVHALQTYAAGKQIINWNEYIVEANRKICEYQLEKEMSLGTTIAGISFCGSEVTAANVGDSRIYRIHKGKISQLSMDHSQYQVILDAGLQLDDRTMRRAKSFLVQFLGLPDEEIKLEPYVIKIDDDISGDYFLLCSDGLWGTLSDEILLEIIQKNEIGKICETLVDEAEKQGSSDNITALLIHVLENTQKNELSQSICCKKEKKQSVIRRFIDFFCK